MLIYFYVTEYKSIKKIYFRKFNKVFLCEKRKKTVVKTALGVNVKNVPVVSRFVSEET